MRSPRHELRLAASATKRTIAGYFRLERGVANGLGMANGSPTKRRPLRKGLPNAAL